MIVLRTLQGLGDAVYAYPIVKYLLENQNQKIIVKTNYPIVFNALNVETVSLDSSQKFNLFPQYTKNRNGSSQYEMMLRSVGLPFISFKFDWQLGFSEGFKFNHLDNFIKTWTDSKKKLCIIKQPCVAHMHKLSKDTSLVPDGNEFREWQIENEYKYFFVSVGKDEIFSDKGYLINYDLVNKTSVQDLLTLCSMANLIASQVGHLIPIAQGFNKPLKIFYPKQIKDRRFKNLSPQTYAIKGIDNLVK